MAVACFLRSSNDDKAVYLIERPQTCTRLCNSTSRQDCVRCGSEHYVGHCDAFASMNSAERREPRHATASMLQLLATRSRSPRVSITFDVQTCGATSHHTLLHEGSRKRAASSHEPGPPAKTRSTSLRHSRTLPQGAWHRRRAVRQSRPD
ncbi:unnamed protein product [Trichogramma brassicae]|uniref:Uncharacterized protein n=1 Tax=Trichogramma brassicae TaxID=86971 RepID=A0A6H5I306_9HYME|nr:unnamed protein product [Trichogramma brassicae]